MKYILSIICLILSAVIFYQFEYYSNHDFQISSDLTAGMDDQSIPAANNTLRSIKAYSEIVNRPLFSKDRKTPAVLSGKTIKFVDISELKGLTLYGVVISGANRYAIVNGEGASAEHIKVGHVYKGWKVSEINPDSVRFDSSKGQYELFISPNDTNKKSGIKKTNNVRDVKKSSVKTYRQSLFRSSQKPRKSPVVIPESNRNVPNRQPSEEDLGLVNEIGDEGGFFFEFDEDFEDEDDLEDEDE